jgi:8-oxo-dGTP diphosphatase
VNLGPEPLNWANVLSRSSVAGRSYIQNGLSRATPHVLERTGDNDVPSAHGSDTRSYKLIGDVHLLLLDSDGRALFGLRQNTGLMDGTYSLPAGHLEDGESVVQAVIREAREEIGVTIDPEDVEFAHVMHSPVTGGRASFFFCVRRWKGIPVNLEPGKCGELRWFSLDELPETLMSYCRVALEHIATGSPFSVCGWKRGQVHDTRSASRPRKGCAKAGRTRMSGHLWPAAA